MSLKLSSWNILGHNYKSESSFGSLSREEAVRREEAWSAEPLCQERRSLTLLNRVNSEKKIYFLTHKLWSLLINIELSTVYNLNLPVPSESSWRSNLTSRMQLSCAHSGSVSSSCLQTCRTPYTSNI